MPAQSTIPVQYTPIITTTGRHVKMEAYANKTAAEIYASSGSEKTALHAIEDAMVLALRSKVGELTGSCYL